MHFWHKRSSDILQVFYKYDEEKLCRSLSIEIRATQLCLLNFKCSFYVLKLLKFKSFHLAFTHFCIQICIYFCFLYLYQLYFKGIMCWSSSLFVDINQKKVATQMYYDFVWCFFQTVAKNETVLWHIWLLPGFCCSYRWDVPVLTYCKVFPLLYTQGTMNILWWILPSFL